MAELKKNPELNLAQCRMRVFDCDGVILDFSQIRVQAFYQAARLRGFQ